MALVVETGAGIINAESFASVAEADAYWSGRSAGTAWLALTTSAKENALRDGSDYVATRLSGGDAVGGLSWPWDGVDATPRARSLIVKATVMAADIARLGPLLGGTAAGGRLVSESKTLGPLSKSATYSDRASPAAANGRDLSFIDTILGPLLRTGGGLILGTTARA